MLYVTENQVNNMTVCKRLQARYRGLYFSVKVIIFKRKISLNLSRGNRDCVDVPIGPGV